MVFPTRNRADNGGVISNKRKGNMIVADWSIWSKLVDSFIFLLLNALGIYYFLNLLEGDALLKVLYNVMKEPFLAVW